MEKKIIEFNKQQIEHIQIMQRLIWDFCSDLMHLALDHDKSKFSEYEYEAFVDSKESLNRSKNGKDEDYQKHLKSDAIQHHINSNDHHPEFWTSKNLEMPITCAISMFFDWMSRSRQKGGNLDDFWEYNMSKLEKQPRAKMLVEYLKTYFEKGTQNING